MDKQKVKKTNLIEKPIVLDPSMQIGLRQGSLVIQQPTPLGVKQTIFELTAPPEVKAEIKKRKEEIKSFAYQFATDAFFTVVSFFVPTIGIFTWPARLMRMGKTAKAIGTFLVNIDKLKAFRYVKPLAEEFKTAFVVYLGEQAVSQFTERVKPTPLFEVYKDFLLGRASIGAFGKGLKAGYKAGKAVAEPLVEFAYSKFPKLPLYVHKALDAFYKTFFGISREAWLTLNKLAGRLQPHLLEAKVAQELFSALDHPEVKKELEQYVSHLRQGLHRRADLFDDKFYEKIQEKVPGFTRDTLKQLSDVIYLKLLQMDNLHSPILASFIERVLQGHPAPTFRDLFWAKIKADLGEIWEDSKKAFVENAWRMTLGAVKKVGGGVKKLEEKPKEEKQLNNLALSFMKRLYEDKGMKKYRTGRVVILHYLFEPLFKLHGHDPFALLTKGLKVNVDTKKLGSMVQNLMEKKEQSFSAFLETLGEYAYKHGTDFFFIRNRVWNLMKGDYRGLQKLWQREYVPIVEQFFEQYIPRLGFKHPLRRLGLKEATPQDILEPLDIDRIYSDSLYKFMMRHHPYSVLKPRFYNSIEDILVIGIPSTIVKILIEHPNLMHEPEKLAEAVLKEFGFTGGLTIPKWIANKFVVPQFMHNLYNHIDEILRHPEIIAKLSDPLTKVHEFTLMDKTVRMTGGMLDALKDYFIAITGRVSGAWQESKVYTINRLWKRAFLFLSPFFHASALTLSALALKGNYRITAWDIVGRALMDSLQVTFRGLSHPEYGYMAKEVVETINQLTKQGYKINEIILSGWNEGEALWGNYILTGKNILHELLKKGDGQAFKELMKEFEKYELKLKADKVLNVVHGFERWLWAGYYQGLKLRTAYALVNAYKKGLLTADDLVKNLNTINYIYGGLHTWYYVNPNLAQFYRLLLFAPDWYLTLFHNFRTWLHGDAPLVMNFFPAILRMRFYLSVYANYAFNGHSPWDNYNLRDPKEWLRLFLKDWPELFKVHVPIVDSRGHYRVFTFNLLGFDIEPLEMVGILPFMKNLYIALSHPTMSLDQRILKVSLGTLGEWIEFWYRKASMMMRFFIKMYEATRPKFGSVKEDAPTAQEDFLEAVQDFAPLALVQLFVTLRYPYKATPEVREVIRVASVLNTVGLKTQVRDNLTYLLFENRHRKQVVSEILTRWLENYREIKQEEKRLKKEFGLKVGKSRDVYKSLLVSLSHAYYNYYMHPWLRKNVHRDFSEIKEEAKKILLLMREDIKASALPNKMKYDLWEAIKKRFSSELWDAYKTIAKRDLPEVIERRIREKRMREEVE
jgi:hypothetical protein